MSKKKVEEEELPDPRIETDEDFDAFVKTCNNDEGWDLCYDHNGIYPS